MPHTPLEARTFGARTHFPYHSRSPDFSLIIRRLHTALCVFGSCMAYNSNINCLVPVLEVPPPPPPHEKSWLRACTPTQYCFTNTAVRFYVKYQNIKVHNERKNYLNLCFSVKKSAAFWFD